MTPEAPIPVRPFERSLERTLYVYVKTNATPARFPRRAGMAVKRPLGGRGDDNTRL
jgi:16S rRNA (guanine527-N7)-methyltransferase